MSSKNILNFQLGTANKYPKLHPTAPECSDKKTKKLYLYNNIERWESESVDLHLKKWNQNLVLAQNEPSDTSNLAFSLQNSENGGHLLLTLPLASEVILLLSYFLSLCLIPQPSFFTLPCNKIIPLLSSAHLTVFTSGWRRTLSTQHFRLSVGLYFTFLYPHMVCNFLLAICMSVTIASSIKHLLFILPLFL